MGSCSDPALDKFNLSEENKDANILRKILDLDSMAENELDWYSTRTFEIFLDALDIKQPVIAEPRKQKCPSEDKIVESDMINGKVIKESPTNSSAKYAVETILSAEALKILSELPDLSLMSTTRSFIFPNGNKGHSKRNL